MAKKWIVKANGGLKGWVTIKTFDSAAKADKWLTDYILKNGYSNSDFLIKAE